MWGILFPQTVSHFQTTTLKVNVFPVTPTKIAAVHNTQMEKRHTLVILISVMVAVLMAGTGLAVGMFFIIQESKTSTALALVHQLEEVFNEGFTNRVNEYIYSLQVVLVMQTFVNISTLSMADFIDLTDIAQISLFKTTNELKFVPYLEGYTERVDFEQLAQQNIDPNFRIVDVIFTSDGPVFSPAANRSYYCPLSYLSPNITTALFDFEGTDLCFSPVWIPLFDRLLAINQSDVKIQSRFTIRTGKYNLDVARTLFDPISGRRVGFAIHSVFFSELIDQVRRSVFQEIAPDTFISVTESNVVNATLLYQDAGFANHTSFPSGYSIVLAQTLLPLQIQFQYRSTTLNIFLTSAGPIVVAIILILCLLIDVAILVFYGFLGRRQTMRKIMELTAQNVYISNMVNYVNHEIRNPLNSVIGMLEIIRLKYGSNETCPDLNEYLTNANNGCLLIQHIVNDILDVKKLEAGKLTINHDMVDLRMFCNQLNQLLSRKIQEHADVKFSLDLQCPDVMEPQVYSDQIRLTQIMINFITNAFKYTESGGHIQTVVTVERETVLFTVTDNGTGINEAKRDQLFKPFQKELNNSPEMARQGSHGLGLYLCRMLVELMHGDIGYTPNQPKGSIFWFRVPKDAPPEQP